MHQYFTGGCALQIVLCAISLSWCGNIRSSLLREYRVASKICSHCRAPICQPKPISHGLFQRICLGVPLSIKQNLLYFFFVLRFRVLVVSSRSSIIRPLSFAIIISFAYFPRQNKPTHLLHTHNLWLSGLQSLLSALQYGLWQ